MVQKVVDLSGAKVHDNLGLGGVIADADIAYFKTANFSQLIPSFDWTN